MKRNKVREEMVKKKQKKLKEGKFKNEAERNMFSKLLQRGSGTNFSVKIGLKNVYKKPFWKGRADSNKTKAIRGEKLLVENNIPVTKFKKKITIQGKEKLVFEKARDMTGAEIQKNFNKILKLTIEAGEKGIFIDPTLNNFGINEKGQIVIRDTDRVREFKKSIALNTNLDTLSDSIRMKFRKDPKYANKITNIIRKEMKPKKNNSIKT